MNELIQTCLNITNAGYEKEDKFDSPYAHEKFRGFASYLLNGSNLGKVFHPEPIVKDYRACNTVAIGFSGGMDSYLAYMYAIKTGLDPILVQVNYDQPYAIEEHAVTCRIRTVLDPIFNKDNPFVKDVKADVLYRTQFIDESVRIPQLHGRQVGTLDSYIIPARNLFLAAICSKYSPRVWIVANKRKNEDVGTPDKTSRFYRTSSQIFSDYYGGNVLVDSPFKQFSKVEAVQLYLDSGGSLDTLKHTFSCYSPVRHRIPRDHCGTCYACFKRFKLFQHWNYEVTFATHPKNGPDWDAFNSRELEKQGE